MFKIDKKEVRKIMVSKGKFGWGRMLLINCGRDCEV